MGRRGGARDQRRLFAYGIGVFENFRSSAMKRLLFLTIAALIAVPQDALACVVAPSPETRAKQAYLSNHTRAVALYRVTRTEVERGTRATPENWNTDVALLRTVMGKAVPSELNFSQARLRERCLVMEEYPAPKTGDEWVLYFKADRDGFLTPWLALPRVAAERSDPHVRWSKVGE